MTPAELLADPALGAVLTALPRARLVGGSVRDALAGRPVADVDLATPELPDAVMTALATAGLKAVPTGIKHGTVTAISDHRGFEVTTLRRDVTTDGRHAEVEWTDDWAVDAARRDFTINAMSMERDGAVFDYFGGRDDLAAGRVRFVGEPAARIAEDYLRILRFFRFQARYGRQEPDAATIVALRSGIDGLARLSPERVWSEFKRILIAPSPGRSVRLMESLGVLSAILPVADVAGLDRVAAGPADPILRLASLRPDAGIAERWRLSGAEREQLSALAGPAPDPTWTDDADVSRALAEAPAEILVGRSWLRDGEAGAAVRARLLDAATPVFTLAGRDALALGVPPGPAVGALIRDVRAWWMQGGCVASAASCRAELARRVALAAPER